jgi:hypothetical protein
MNEQKWGDFIVRRSGDHWADEMMLHTHGGYDPDDGMAEIEAGDICFYANHPVTITFDFAHPIMRGEKGGEAIRSTVSSNSQVWNYKLQALTDDQRNESMCHWMFRFGKPLPQWDWWEVGLKDKKMSTMQALARKMRDFAYLENHTYRRMHFLCCREWMGSSAAPSFGALKAPKSQ